MELYFVGVFENNELVRIMSAGNPRTPRAYHSEESAHRGIRGFNNYRGGDLRVVKVDNFKEVK